LNRLRQYLRRGPRRQRPEPFRSRPTLEALEDRVVPSFAIQSGSALLVGASPGAPGQVRTITLEADPTDPTKLDVFDTNTLLGQFSIASINSAAVSVQGNDAINVNDRNGDPFNGATDVTLFGSGSNNSLDLRGNRSLGGDFFRAGTVTPTSEQDGELAVGFALFQFNHAVNFVSDEVPLVPNVVTTVEAP